MKEILALVFCVAGIIVISIPISFVLRAASRTRTTIAPPTITKWIQCFTPEEFIRAGADVFTAPFGNKGQHIGYVLYANPDMKKWDVEEKLYAEIYLQRPHDRIKVLFSRKDLFS